MGSLFLLLGCNLSYFVDVFAALHRLASASARTLLKLASSVRALLKPYWATLRTFAPKNFPHTDFFKTLTEHPWKFPDCRMACGLTPLGEKKFSSFWLTGALLVGIVRILSAEFPDWVAVLVVGFDEVDAGGVFSLPWVNVVSAWS